MSETVEFDDHFSLITPPSKVRFRNTQTRVYGSNVDDQLIISCTQAQPQEEEGDINDEECAANNTKITLKRYENFSFIGFLRRWYCAIMSFIVASFLLVVCIDFTFSVFMEPAPDKDNNHKNRYFYSLVSIPFLAYTNSYVMTSCGIFVSDTYQQMKFLRRLINIPDVIIDWIVYLIFLIVPATCAIVNLILLETKWWERTVLITIGGIFLLLLFFTMTVFCHEISLCYDLIHSNNLTSPPGPEGVRSGCSNTTRKIFEAVKSAIQLRQRQKYSGCIKVRYIVKNNFESEPSYNNIDDENITIIGTSESLYSKLTEKLGCFCFERLDTAEKIYKFEEVQEVLPMLTSNNFAITNLTNHNFDQDLTLMRDGEYSPINRHNSRSAVAFEILSTLLPTIVFGLILSSLSGSYLLLAVLVAILLFSKRQSRHFVKHSRDIKTVLKDQDSRIFDQFDHSFTPSVSKFTEYRAISRPSANFCWGMFFVEIVLFYLYPLVHLYFEGQFQVANTMFFTQGFTLVRHYFNLGVIVKHLGPLSQIKMKPQNEPTKSHRRKSSIFAAREDMTLSKTARVLEICKKISCNSSLDRWMSFFVYWMLFVSFFALYVTSQGKPEEFSQLNYKFAEGFYYPPATTALYPTCRLGGGFTPDGNNPEERGTMPLMDYVFLSLMTYGHPNETTPLLDSYFGPNVVKEETTFIHEYRQNISLSSPVSFKMFSFLDSPGSYVVGIKGTSHLYDWENNFMTWTKPGLFQLVRLILPIGSIFNPAFVHLSKAAQILVKSERRSNSYYHHHTSEFVEYLKNVMSVNNIILTGHSLGGGLAIITGAKTQVNTVAVSGVNALISRETFNPPISENDINSHTLNIIPDGDIIPRVDDAGNLVQNIRCPHPFSPSMCHSAEQTLCELAFTCGSFGRSVFCQCTSIYGYPEPIQNGTKTWAEACGF